MHQHYCSFGLAKASLEAEKAVADVRGWFGVEDRSHSFAEAGRGGCCSGCIL